MISQFHYFLSLKFFDGASTLYLISALLYLIYIVYRNSTVATTARLLTTAGWIAHTVALILRWKAAGLEHPPWSNLYESIVFFVWGMLLVYQVVQYRMYVPLVGSFVLPFAVIGLGVAAFGTDREITPLVPALRSKWIFIHVAMACIAYPSFLVGSVFALLYLMKDKVPKEYFGAAVAALSGSTVLVTMGYPFIPLSFVQEFSLTSVALYFMAFLFYSLAIKRSHPFFEQWGQGGQWGQWAKRLLMGALLVHAGDLSLIFYHSVSHPEDLLFHLIPFKIGMSAAALLMVILFMFYGRFEEKLIQILPNKDMLDRLSFKANLFGLPMVTLLLVTGGIWAHSAWGRFWGWDPKETWGLITWFTYAIYIHSRLVSGWKGRKSAVISLIGFFVVMFTYLGVNVLLSGLHSYGRPNPES